MIAGIALALCLTRMTKKTTNPFNFIEYAVVAFFFTEVSSFSALAAHKAPTPEVYSAIENSEAPPEAVAPPTATTPAQTSPTLPIPPPVTSEREPPYETVPSSQIEAFHRRLQLVDLLMREHNRAYDYRTLTLKQLEKLTHDLKAKKAVKVENLPTAD